MPNKQYERFTFSMNPKDPSAVLNAKQIDAAIRQVVSQLQKEGERVHRSERYAQGGMINADYYVPAGSAQMALNAANEALERLRNPSGISFSSASPVSMSSWSGTIMDPRMRAQIARLVDRSGGMFSTNDQGISSYMIDKGRVARNTGGQFVNASSYISRMIRSSNEQHVAGWESLMGQANINASYNDYDESERAAMESAAKSLKSRRAKRAVTIAAEREETYARLERRRHREEAEKQYEVDHPDDPVVIRRRKAREVAARAKRRRSVSKAGKFVGRFIVGALAGVLTFLGVSVGLLNRIRDAILDVGGKVRGQNMGAQAYNLNVNTVQNWERFAAKRGYDKGLLTQSVGELASKFSNPLFYTSAAFSGIAPFIKDDTAALASAANAGGAENMLSIQRTVIKRLTEASKRGEAGGKFGISPDQAFAENLEAAKQGLGSATADMFSKYWYDTKGSVDFDAWRSGNMSPEYGSGTMVNNGATRRAAEGTYNSVQNMLGSYGAAGEDVMRVISGYLKELVEMFRSLLGNVFEKFFPELALQERQRNTYNNARSSQLLDTMMPTYQKRAKAVLDKYGITMGASDVVDAIMSGGAGLTTKQLTGLLNDKNYEDVTALANANAARKKLDALMSGGNKGSYFYTPEDAANEVFGNSWLQSVKMEDILKNRTGETSLGGFTPSVGGAAALRNKALFLSAVGSTKKSLATKMASLSAGMNGSPASLISSAEDDLNALLYYYSVVPGHEADAQATLNQIIDFQKTYGGDVEHVFKNGVMRRSLDTSSQDKKIADARKAMKDWQVLGTGGGVSTSLDTRAARWRTLDSGADTLYGELLKAVSNGSLSVPGLPTGLSSMYSGSDSGGVNGGQGDAGNVILNQTINGQKTTTTVPLRRNPSGDRVGDINGGNTTAPYIDAINNAMNRQNY